MDTNNATAGVVVEGQGLVAPLVALEGRLVTALRQAARVAMPPEERVILAQTRLFSLVVAAAAEVVVAALPTTELPDQRLVTAGFLAVVEEREETAVA